MNFKHLITLGAMACVLSLGGCGNSTAEEPEAPLPPVADTRFATLESTLQYYNTVATNDPINFDEMLRLIYPESDLHKRLIEINKQLKPLYELDRLMFQVYGEGWEPGRKKPMSAPDQPAQLVKSEAQRGEATCIDSRGKKETIQFVKIGDRWWVSGYTLEYEPEVRQYLDKIDVMERVAPAIAAAASNVRMYVQSRQIRSAADARKSVVFEAAQKSPTFKEDFAKIAGG